MNGEAANGSVSYLRVRFSLISVTLGLLIFTIGAKPNWYGWDRSPVVGFIQIAVFLMGLALICLGGFVGLSALWGKEQRSIIADIGLRVVGTGFVISVFTGLADVFGMGSQPLPNVPYFGPWQAGGVLIGQLVIALGFLMVIPYHLYFQKLDK
ncbi:MAG TPA: hypothetical protein VFY26_12565 [Anaerolineales bacterium]|nr:hypothetical protein [Anaerolineales bacterium]